MKIYGVYCDDGEQWESQASVIEHYLTHELASARAKWFEDHKSPQEEYYSFSIQEIEVHEELPIEEDNRTNDEIDDYNNHITGNTNKDLFGDTEEEQEPGDWGTY